VDNREEDLPDDAEILETAQVGVEAWRHWGVSLLGLSSFALLTLYFPFPCYE
jgi:hypothetical protein